MKRPCTFCLEYDRGSETIGRLAAKAGDYARLEEAWGVELWVLVVVPGPRREAGARAALGGCGLAVATTTHAGARTPAGAMWAPLDAECCRLRLAGLVARPRPAASVGRLARAARSRETGRWSEEEVAG